VEPGIGLYLRELRQGRGIPLERVAREASIGRATLSRWEAGLYQPRVPELESVLKALGTSAGEQERAFTLLRAPRALRRLREEPATRGEEPTFPPSSGDLLRAMRRRRELTVEQIAAALRVEESTVSRWEQSRTVPPPERLEALFDLLHAHPEERRVLVQGRLLLSPHHHEPPPLDELEERLKACFREAQRGGSPLTDLTFLQVEAALWARRAEGSAAQFLLARTYMLRAQWAAWRGILTEQEENARRALDLLRHVSRPSHLWVPAALLAAQTLGGRRRKAERVLVELERWLPVLTWPGAQTILYRDMASFAADDGQIDRALACIGKAARSLEDAQSGEMLRTIRLHHAEILLKAGRPEAAASVLPDAEQGTPFERAVEAETWVEAFLALRDTSAAQSWLNRALCIQQEHHLTTRQPRTDRLAARF
jgi:transcriptional regulator with XRE-family HTH domain